LLSLLLTRIRLVVNKNKRRRHKEEKTEEEKREKGVCEEEDTLPRIRGEDRKRCFSAVVNNRWHSAVVNYRRVSQR
jgi:hypothetical protein